MDKIIKTKVKVNQIHLYNTEAPSHTDYGNMDYTKVQNGDEINIWIRPFTDGRVYYTAFKKINGVYYCFTSMKDSGGKMIPNCGGLSASKDLKKKLG